MLFQYCKEGDIGRISMVNPPYGAMVDPVFADLNELRQFFAEKDLKAVTLQGAGRHFCSGADPQCFAALSRDLKALENRLSQAKALLDILRYAPLPTVAVISGSCFGGGLELALACHFRFAAGSAMFGFPESGFGFMPGLGGTLFPQPLIGRGQLMELILSGRMIGAEEALQLGLVDRVASVKSIGKEADDFLHSLTSRHPSFLIRAVMQSLHNGSRMNMKDALAEETRLFCELVTISGGERR